MNPRLLYLALVTIFIIASGVRLSYISTMQPATPFGPDSQKYTGLAINLVEKQHYHFDLNSDKQISYIAPGYPVFAASIMAVSNNFDDFFLKVVTVQSFLWGGIAVLMALVGLKIVNQWVGLLTGLMIALSPHLIVIAGYILTETLFTFFLASALLFLTLYLEKKSILLLVLFVIFSVAASLVRPVFIIVPILFIGYLVFNLASLKASLKLKHSIVLACLTISLMLPWSIWKATTEQAEGQLNLLREAFHLGSYPNLTFRDGPKGFPRLSDKSYMEKGASWDKSISYMVSRYKQEPINYTIWYLFGKPAMFWRASILQGQGGPFIYQVNQSIFDTNKFFAATKSIFLYLHTPIVIIAFCFGGIQFYQNFRKPSYPITTSSFLFCILIAYTGIHMVLVPLPRYSIVLYPIIYLLFANSVFVGYSWIKSKHNQL